MKGNNRTREQIKSGPPSPSFPALSTFFLALPSPSAAACLRTSSPLSPLHRHLPLPSILLLKRTPSPTHPFLPYRNSEREKGLFMEGEQHTTACPRCVPPTHVLYLLLHYARTDRLHTFYKGGGDTLFCAKKIRLARRGQIRQHILFVDESI